MNRLDPARRAQVITCLAEGNSIRSTVRMTGVAKNTVTKLLVEVGAAFSAYQDRVMRNLNCKTVQVDEIWAFVGCKQKNVKVYADTHVMGDVWTWVALDADTKLVPSYLLGNRDGGTARVFMEDLASRLSNRIQLTSDGHATYLRAVPAAFGEDVDWGILYKQYGNDVTSGPERRYSPGVCIGAEKQTAIGNPDHEKIPTSYVERQNLSMRMGMRRFTRLTNAFSKKVENHAAAIAVYLMYYNFCRKRQTIKTTPAMAAGIADHAWSVAEVVALADSN
ncbi:MAG: IS1 family transposase [Bryobacteraceae bacterium]